MAVVKEFLFSGFECCITQQGRAEVGGVGVMPPLFAEAVGKLLDLSVISMLEDGIK